MPGIPTAKKKAASKIAMASKKSSTSKKRFPVQLETPSEAKTALFPEMESHFNTFIREIAGKEGMRIVESIGDAGSTDEAIEEKTTLKIAEVRCILNHLHSYGVVEYNREKNLKNGWFTYTWSVNRERALQNYLQIKRREYDELRKRVAYADGASVYKCRKGCGKYEFDVAMDCQFRCPKCKGNLKHEPKDEKLKIEERVRNLEAILNRSPLAMAQQQVQLPLAK